MPARRITDKTASQPKTLRHQLTAEPSTRSPVVESPVKSSAEPMNVAASGSTNSTQAEAAPLPPAANANGPATSDDMKNVSLQNFKTEENSREFILKAARDRNVKFVRLWFTDILGMLKSTAITAEELESALAEGVTFDGSAVEGFAREDESDMLAVPDPNTFALLPFRPTEGGAVARVFCDIMRPDGQPAETDPRYILKKQLRAAAELGYTFYVGPEVEFFYFKAMSGEGPHRPQVLDQGGYFDLTPLDVASGIRRQTVLTLEQMDIGVESSHHEAARSQHEIDLRYTDALTMADNLMTFRLVVKEVAYENNCHATFMPKPTSNENGSGMHINMSLFKGHKNVFYDKNSEEHLSNTARKFIAGLLRHARELTLFTNQWVNSYKRLVPGYEAPTRVTWAMRNRADLVRVPAYKVGRDASRRVEYRSPDAACNPYLVFALLLAAGLEGIRRNYPIPEVVGGIHQMSTQERKEAGVEVLPSDLNEAIRAARESQLARRVLGDTLFQKFLDNKKMEWDTYRAQVHQYELDRYLSVL
ncbi:MAG TPA: type I glutamate--ammonia ligase [Abditibacteriaceae bacterium]